MDQGPIRGAVVVGGAEDDTGPAMVENQVQYACGC